MEIWAKETVYNAARFAIPPEKLRELSQKSFWRLPACLVLNWLIVFGLASLFLHGGHHALYPLAAILVAGRQGALLNMGHELAHGLWRAGPRLADFVARWLLAYPLGVDYDGYKAAHVIHHRHANTELDPAVDREKYQLADIRDPRLWRLFLKDLSGLTALQVFFSYASQGGPLRRSLLELIRGVTIKILRLSLPNLFLLFVVFRGSIPLYLALWIFPAMSVHMFFMRIRGIAEHGLGLQLGVKDLSKNGMGTLYTRSMLTFANGIGGWVERLLLGSMGINFHHEHHLFPVIPFHQLGKLHRLIRTEVLRHNPHAYVRGYTQALFNPVRGAEDYSRKIGLEARAGG